MDPQLPTQASVGDIDTLLVLYDQLTNIKPHTLDQEPGLAESWESSKDGLQWTFHLRSTAFSNGDPVTADDVKFSLERFANPKINSQYFALLSAIQSVRALDSRTVRVTLQYPQGMFLACMGHGTASIVPKRLVEADDKKFQQNPVGSGAFMLESKVPAQSISFVRNPHYWKTGQPYLDRLKFNYVTDGNARTLQVASGQANAAPIPYGLIAQYRNHPGTKLQFEHTTNVIFVSPNLKQHPYDDVNVRFALNYATPREAINKAVFDNLITLGNSVIGELKYWDPSVPTYPYDIAKAKSYMAKSKVPNGFTTTLLIDGTDSDSRAVAAILQNSWSQIGIQAHLELSDLNTMLTRSFKYDYQILFWPPDYSSSDVGPDDELASLFYDPLKAGIGIYAYDVPSVTRLLGQATHTFDQPTRQRIFRYLQRYTTLVDPDLVPIGFGPARTLLTSNVNGLVTLLNYSYRWENVWLS